MVEAQCVWVELFGMPRLLAARPEIQLPWRAGLTLGEIPRLLRAVCPSLDQVVGGDGQTSAAYVFNLNGRDFVRDPDLPIAAGDRLLLLSADSGG